MNYVKEAFYPRDIGHAKEICLSPDSRIPNKFEKETELTIETLVSNVYAHNNSVVLDFGCGVGRLSKGLIQRLGCDVVGVDFSEPMLHTASEYVMSRKFMPLLSPITDTIKLDLKNKFDLALAVYVLQHSPTPNEDIQFIYDSLTNDGKFIFTNENIRFIPVGVDSVNSGLIYWDDDGVDIIKIILDKFNLVKKHPYPKRFDIEIMVFEKKI